MRAMTPSFYGSYVLESKRRLSQDDTPPQRPALAFGLVLLCVVVGSSLFRTGENVGRAQAVHTAAAESCPLDCGRNGLCDAGACACYNGFHGADCSMKPGGPACVLRRDCHSFGASVTGYRRPVSFAYIGSSVEVIGGCLCGCEGATVGTQTLAGGVRLRGVDVHVSVHQFPPDAGETWWREEITLSAQSYFRAGLWFAVSLNANTTSGAPPAIVVHASPDAAGDVASEQPLFHPGSGELDPSAWDRSGASVRVLSDGSRNLTNVEDHVDGTVGDRLLWRRTVVVRQTMATRLPAAGNATNSSSVAAAAAAVPEPVDSMQVILAAGYTPEVLEVMDSVNGGWGGWKVAELSLAERFCAEPHPLGYDPEASFVRLHRFPGDLGSTVADVDPTGLGDASPLVDNR